MIGQRSARAGRWQGELALALVEPQLDGEHVVSGVTRTTAGLRWSRDARGRFEAGANVTPKAPRVRTLPSRDNRGRFVSYPTTNAPSWYVFCCGDGYRIPREAPTSLLPPIAPVAPHALPRAIAQLRRPWLTRSDLQSGLLVLIVLLVSALYWWHLPPPHW
jgi:hypothetical protein